MEFKRGDQVIRKADPLKGLVVDSIMPDGLVVCIVPGKNKRLVCRPDELQKTASGPMTVSFK